MPLPPKSLDRKLIKEYFFSCQSFDYFLVCSFWTVIFYIIYKSPRPPEHVGPPVHYKLVQNPLYMNFVIKLYQAKDFCDSSFIQILLKKLSSYIFSTCLDQPIDKIVCLVWKCLRCLLKLLIWLSFTFAFSCETEVKAYGVNEDVIYFLEATYPIQGYVYPRVLIRGYVSEAAYPRLPTRSYLSKATYPRLLIR